MNFWDFTKLLPRAIEKYNMERETRASLICKKFRDFAPSIVGEKVFSHMNVKYYKNGILYVGVSHSAYAQYLHIHRHDIITKININLKNEWLKDLKTLVEN